MAVVVSGESFRAVIALVFLRIVLSSSWALDAVFSVPEWEFRWALARFVFGVPDSSVSFFVGRAFTLSGSGVDLPWGGAWDFAIASVELGVVEVSLRARLAFSANGIPEKRGSTLNTVVSDFIISSRAA